MRTVRAVAAIIASIGALVAIYKVGPTTKACQGLTSSLPKCINSDSTWTTCRDSGLACLKTAAAKHPEWTAATIGAVYIPLKVMGAPELFLSTFALFAGALFQVKVAVAMIVAAEFLGSFANADGSMLTLAVASHLGGAITALFAEFVGPLVATLLTSFLLVTLGQQIPKFNDLTMPNNATLFTLFITLGVIFIGPLVCDKIEAWYYPSYAEIPSVRRPSQGRVAGRPAPEKEDEKEKEKPKEKPKQKPKPKPKEAEA